MTHPTSPRWWQLTPERFLYALIAAQGFLYLSEQYGWFWFNERIAWTMLVNLLVVTSGLLLLALTYLGSLLLRRGFRFSLRTLLLLITTVGIACGWYQREVERGKEIEVVRTTREFHYKNYSAGFVHMNGFSELFIGRRDFLVDPFRIDQPNQVTRFVNWVDHKIGANSFSQIGSMTAHSDQKLTKAISLSGRTLISVSFEGKSMDAKTANRLASCPKLRYLYLKLEVVTDELMEAIGRLRQLETLDVDGTPPPAFHISPYTHWPNLKELSLWKLELDSEGIRKIAASTQLEILDLSGCNFSSSDLKYLSNLPHLKNLRLPCTYVSDECLEHLPPTLVHLDLRGNRITSKGLAKLAQLPRLETLELNDADFTEDNLVLLRELRRIIREESRNATGLRRLMSQP